MADAEDTTIQVKADKDNTEAGKVRDKTGTCELVNWSDVPKSQPGGELVLVPRIMRRCDGC